MKTIIFIISTFCVITFSRVLAEEVKTTDLQSSDCNVQMSIALQETQKEIKTNQPINLVIHIKNVSTNEIFYLEVFSLPTDFSWNITSPSGKNLVLKESAPEDSFSTMLVRLVPNQIKEFEFDLSSVCSLNEIGTYKVFAKKEVESSIGQKKCEVISNPLAIIISR